MGSNADAAIAARAGCAAAEEEDLPMAPKTGIEEEFVDDVVTMLLDGRTGVFIDGPSIR